MLRLLAFLIALPILLSSSDAFAQNRFWLVNNSGQTIEQAYVSSAREQSWGPDILGRSVLSTGNRIRVEPVFGDCVLDVRIVYASGQSEERRNLNACNTDVIAFGRGSSGSGAGANIRGASRGGDPSFSFINGASSTIRELYVSSSTISSWGNDRLGQNILQPGQSVWVPVSGGGCNVDIRVVFNNGQSRETRNVETCSRQSLRWR